MRLLTLLAGTMTLISSALAAATKNDYQNAIKGRLSEICNYLYGDYNSSKNDNSNAKRIICLPLSGSHATIYAGLNGSKGSKGSLTNQGCQDQINALISASQWGKYGTGADKVDIEYVSIPNGLL